jgi:transposase
MDVNVYSIDEKSGIQALERIMGVAPKSKGLINRVESEYIRHGTVTLIAVQNIKDGSIPHFELVPTRTEEDFVNFMAEMIKRVPAGEKAVFLMDQLNTHKSESLVMLFARENEYTGNLGKKGKKGILKSQKSRMSFLENSNFRLRILYTPKHCSWLNPVENYFSKIQRHVIIGGSFTSVENLKSKIVGYINYSNQFYLKSLKWKFKGFNKMHPLGNANRA